MSFIGIWGISCQPLPWVQLLHSCCCHTMLPCWTYILAFLVKKKNQFEAFFHVVTRMGRLKQGGGGRRHVLREGESEGEVPAVGRSMWAVSTLWLCLGFHGGPGMLCEEAGVLSWRWWRAIGGSGQDGGMSRVWSCLDLALEILGIPGHLGISGVSNGDEKGFSNWSKEQAH